MPRSTPEPWPKSLLAGRTATGCGSFFPQLRGLGRPPAAHHYGLEPEEAAAFLADPLLGPRLEHISRTLLAHAATCRAVAIFGAVDALKLRSSTTLFAAEPDADPVFGEVPAASCNGSCPQTLALLDMARINRL